MEFRIILVQNLKRHKGNFIGIFLLVLLLTSALLTGAHLWSSSENYIEKEMQSIGFGDLTVWVSGLENTELLMDELHGMRNVADAQEQNVIYAEYEINGMQSDSEGILMKNQPDAYPYKVFRENFRGYKEMLGQDLRIHPGIIFLPASAVSMYGAKTGDTITFTIARNGMKKVFTVEGFFEDPVMGSSMIGMKSFLIGAEDYEEIAQMIRESGIDGLARAGSAIHIEKSDENTSIAELNDSLQKETSIASYIEFSHSKEVMLGFMMTLQQFMFAMLLVFAICLLIVTGIVITHSIHMVKEQDLKNLGILKTIGFTSRKIGFLQMFMYFVPLFCGSVLGIFTSWGLARFMNDSMVTTLGVRISGSRGVAINILISFALILVILFFVYIQIKGLKNITPMDIVRNQRAKGSSNYFKNRISEKYLLRSLAIRNILSRGRNYIGVLLISISLVFLMALVNRMDDWLGKDGKGLMEAFNPADLHIAAQSMGDVTAEMIENRISGYTKITDQYGLAMPEVRVENINLTANVITEPERFHMLQGETSKKENQVVLTEFLASDLGVSIGDTVTISADLGSAEYVVTGIYQCANDMGMNLGLSSEGYGRIGSDKPNMWCIHYFIEDTDQQKIIMKDLEETFSGDVYLHENSWPGLYGILSVMESILITMYIIVILVILIVALLVGKRLLSIEQQDMAIYHSVGFTARKLRKSFAIRFLIVSFAGAAVGLLISMILTDKAVSILLSSFGISNFHSTLMISNSLVPIVTVTGAFTIFSWLVSNRIKKLKLINMIKGE